MPSTVNALLDSASLTWTGAVPWSTKVPLDQPGIYIVAVSESLHDTATLDGSQIFLPAVEALLDTRAELQLDGRRPSVEQLAERLQSMWLPDETVVYVGLAGTSVAKRIEQYYKTALGARAPHAGGWPLKTVACIDRLWVHYAACKTVDVAERAMLETFINNVSISSRTASCDPNLPLPFANLTLPDGPRKRHGISGARAPRSTATSRPTGRISPTPAQAHIADKPVAPESISPQGNSQPVRSGDFMAGRIRIPKATKHLFPNYKATIGATVRGQSIEARWDPRNGPDRERSGVLTVGRSLLTDHLLEGDVLTVSQQADGSVELS